MNMVSLLGFRDQLLYPLSSDLEAVMVLANHNTAKFIDRLRGQSTVFVVSSPTGREAVEVYSPDGSQLVTVSRGIDYSPIMAHPAGACVEFQGLPVDPCMLAGTICSSEDAIETLQDCLGVNRTDLVALIESIRERPALRQALALAAAAGLADDVEVRRQFIASLASNL